MRNPKSILRIVVLAGAAALFADPTARQVAHPESPVRQDPPSAKHPAIVFSEHVKPILERHCIRCHAGAVAKGGFSIESRESMLAREGAIVPGDAAASVLIHLVRGDDPLAIMPKEGKRLTLEEIALLSLWIDQGAPWDEGFTFRGNGPSASIKPRRPQIPMAREGLTNPIDLILNDYFVEHGAEPTAIAGDRMFMRRAYLDLIGLLPPPDRLNAFAADGSPDKRKRLIDDLLADQRSYADHWLSFWNDLLCNDYAGTGYIDGGRTQITQWLHDSLASNEPYDRFVAALVNPTETSAGFANGITWRGETSASQIRELQYARNVSQVFLGVNIKCASCHDSFVDQWKLADAYGMAAIVADRPLELHRCDNPTGELATARFLFPEIGDVDPGATRADRMRQFAEIMTDPDNGRLTRTIVNRLWTRMMGRGIIEPVDDMSGEPWSEDLLDALAVDLVDHGYDLKRTLRLIAMSLAYQRQSIPSDSAVAGGEGFVFRGPAPQRMTAEQFVDAVWMITGGGPMAPDAPISAASVSGEWIWSYAEASRSVPEAGETIALRRIVDVPGGIVSALAVITCDNEYTLSVNGQDFGGDAEWWTVETIDLSAALKPGLNEILVVARNLGDAPNPAGLFFHARLRPADGGEIALVSDDEQWSFAPVLRSHGQCASRSPVEWRPAAAVENQSFLGPDVNASISRAVAAIAAPAEHDNRAFVRASLMASDALMRSLGRPNREQVVTSRPGDLTTPQALDLTNGPTLADQIARGANSLLAVHGSDSARLIDHLFESMLSRRPTDAERAIAREILSNEPTPETLADLVWAMFMLPEFQLVR